MVVLTHVPFQLILASRLVRDLRSDMLSTTNAVSGCIADMMDEVCQMSNEVI